MFLGADGYVAGHTLRASSKRLILNLGDVTRNWSEPENVTLPKFWTTVRLKP